MNDFDIIKQQNRIEDFVPRVVGKPLKKTGQTLSLGECPMCKHHDCFRIFVKTQTYKCFSCGSGGDLFHFTGDFHGIANNYEILKRAAEHINYTLTNSQDVQKKSPREHKKRLAFQAAAQFYRDTLLANKQAMQILSQTRKYTAKTIEEFNIGYSGDAPDMLIAALSKDFSAEDLVDFGLAKIRKDKPGDYFVAKLFVFPHYLGNQVVDFTIKDSQKAKKKKGETVDYRLMAEHRIGKVYFYNQDALYHDEVIVVEGEHDAIQLMRATGKKNVLAITGNPGEDAIKFLEKSCDEKIVYLGFDNDPAGNRYTQQFFFRLWGMAAQVLKINWDGTAKDIDEFLRWAQDSGLRMNIAGPQIIQNATDAMMWVVAAIPDDDDISKLVRALTPFKNRMLEIDNPIQFEIALETIRGHFKKGKAVSTILTKQYEKEKLDRITNADYLDNLPFFEKNGCYYHRSNRGPVNLSNFHLTINDIILFNDELTYRCDLKSVAGEVAENVQFDPSERVDVRRFRTKCVSVGAFHFTGRDNELSGIWQFEESRAQAQMIHYVQNYGRIQAENLWLFDNCAIKDGVIYERDSKTDMIRVGKKQYLPYDVKVYSGATPKLEIAESYDDQFTENVAESFHRMIDSMPSGRIESYAGYLFLGFIPAIIYSDEIYQKYGFFPFLFSYGPSGTGKTTATALLFSLLGFIAQPESWPSATEPGTYQFLQQLSSLPCWYDEFLNDRTFHQLLGTIKNIYNRTGSGKGGLQKRTIRDVKGVLWLSGEDNPQNEAVLSRSVIFRFTPLNTYKNKAYKYLSDNRRLLSTIARQLLLEKNEDTAKMLLRQIQTYHEYIMQKSQKVDPRVAANHAIPAAALQLLNVAIPPELDEYVVLHAERTMKFKEEENPRYLFFSELNYLFSRGLLTNLTYFDPVMNELYVRFEPAIKVMATEMRKRNDNLRIKANSIQDYLKDMPAYLGSGRKRFGSDEQTQKRCMIFDYAKLGETIKETIDDIISYE